MVMSIAERGAEKRCRTLGSVGPSYPAPPGVIPSDIALGTIRYAELISKKRPVAGWPKDPS
jgi:hypothetical protein